MLRPEMTSDELWAALPGVPVEELAALLDHPAADEKHVLKTLERTDLPAPFLQLVAKSRWVRSLRVQYFLVNHPHTPVAEAMNLVKFLFWRDLNYTTQNFRIPPEVRHAAEGMLIQRLPALAIGEKMALARLAGGQILKMLRLDKDARVIEALLDNPRAVEEDVLYIINQGRTPAPVLESIARDPKWSCRKEVRVALLRNPATPLSLAIPFVAQMSAADLKNLANDGKVPTAVRRMIQTRLGGHR